MWFVNTCKKDLHIHHYIYFASKTKRELSTWDAMIVQNKTELQKWRMVKIVELVFWVFTFITVFNNIFTTFYYVPHDETHASFFFFFCIYTCNNFFCSKETSFDHNRRRYRGYYYWLREYHLQFKVFFKVVFTLLEINIFLFRYNVLS